MTVMHQRFVVELLIHLDWFSRYHKSFTGPVKIGESATFAACGIASAAGAALR